MTAMWPGRSLQRGGAALLLGSALAFAPSAESSDKLGDLRVNLELKEHPLRLALAELGETAGVAITIAGPDELPAVSVQLRDVAFWKSLNRILESVDYSVEWSKDRALAIHISGVRNSADRVGGESATRVAPAPAPQADYLDRDSAVDRENVEDSRAAVPEMELLDLSDRRAVPANVTLVPPSSAEGRNITGEDLRSQIQSREDTILGIADLVPGLDEAISEITLEELELARTRAAERQSSEFQIVPAEDE